MPSKPWSGRFTQPTDKQVEQFTESVSFDWRLWPYDIEASKAHAEMLAEVGLLTQQECQRLVRALGEIAAEIEAGRFQFKVELEDVHMNVEAALIERVGDLGRKLHSGRSRNDQVATDLRLWLRDAIDRLSDQLRELQRAFLELAERSRDIVMPGYTHLQRAQPVLAAHYMLAYIEKFERDRERLADCRRRVNVLPLGAAALAGTSLPIDPELVRRKLGFDAVAANSLDAVSDRDFAAEFLSCLALLGVHLSGWAEEWTLWSTTEFGFIELPDAYCTGSSIMPQKRNPDTLELTRGKAARLLGDLTAMLALLKALPLAYNRDLQEDKPLVFDAADTAEACLRMAAPVVREARLNVQRIAAGLDEGFLDATSLMEYLVRRGVPMRAAHEMVGQLVRRCVERGCQLAGLPLAELQAAAPEIEEDVYESLGTAKALRLLRSPGSGGHCGVEQQLAAWRQRLK